jgi:hypothetical protein
MLTDKLKALAQTRAKLAELENSVAAELNKELAALPAKYGYDDPQSFIEAVRAATGGKGGRKVAKAAKPSASKRRKRAVITDETKAKVKSLVESGKTGEEIAKSVGISLPSVQNIKKELGLVKARKK